MLKKNKKLKILLSPLLVILTMILLPSAGMALIFLPLIFSLSVSLVNHNHLKVKSKPLGVLIATGQSYVVFLGMAIVLYILDEFMPEMYMSANRFDFKGIALVTIGGYLAGLLLFYFYSFLFRVENLRISFLYITVCYIFVVAVMHIFSKNEFLQFGVEKFTSFLISWLIFMSLAYSLSMNDEGMFKFLKKNWDSKV
ncbi:MAG: hypothetical protein WCY16_09605 [Weeksellaceae bacterium]